jgi:hypothetical protein
LEDSLDAVDKEQTQKYEQVMKLLDKNWKIRKLVMKVDLGK